MLTSSSSSDFTDNSARSSDMVTHSEDDFWKNPLFNVKRFFKLSSKDWISEVDAVMVKLSRSMKLAGVCVFLPQSMKFMDVKIQLSIHSITGDVIYHQEDVIGNLFSTRDDKVAEMRIPDGLVLESHRRYYIVTRMAKAVNRWAGNFGHALHCLETATGYVLAVFSSVDNNDLEEFLENFENKSTTQQGQIPAINLEEIYL